MLSRIRAWLSNDGGERDDGGANEEEPEVDRTRPLVPLRREEFVAGGGFVVLDGDRPGSGVPGEDLNRLHGAATERFDLAAVEGNHKVADVELAADGQVIGVEWYDDPVPVAERFRR